MKRVKFGINEDATLEPGFSKIDLTNLLGEYLDTISINDNNYLITRVLISGNGTNNDRIDVREIAQDIYTDGNITNYSNLEKSEMCIKLEKVLNAPDSKEQLRIGEPVSEILKQNKINYVPAYIIDIFNRKRFEAQTSTVTSVTPHLFENLKKMNKLKLSVYQMYDRIMEYQSERAHKETSKKI